MTLPYRLDPQVAGELGDETVLDSSTHPPLVSQVDYVLDQPDADDLIQSFPIFLISTGLGSRLQDAGLTGFALAGALVRPSENYLAIYGAVPHPQYMWFQVIRADIEADCWLDESLQLCVSDRMMRHLEAADLSDCLIEELTE